jgi:hypothetical protein
VPEPPPADQEGTLKAIAGGAGHFPCIATRGNRRHKSSTIVLNGGLWVEERERERVGDKKPGKQHTATLYSSHNPQLSSPRTSQFVHAFWDSCNVDFLAPIRPGIGPPPEHQHGLATMHHATPLEMGLALPGPFGILSDHNDHPQWLARVCRRGIRTHKPLGPYSVLSGGLRT